MATNNTVIRISGFDKPWDELQMATWALYPLLILHFCLFLRPLLWDTLYIQVVVIVTFSLTAIVAAVAAYLTCVTDACDAAVRQKKANGENRAISPAVSQAGTIYCYLCETDVHSSSKHCRYCNKCVERFDHHCKWLNSCVGAKNYKYFLLLVSSVGLMTTISFAVAVALLVESYMNPDHIYERVYDSYLLRGSFNSSEGKHYGQANIHVVQGLLIASITILCGLVAMIYQLCSFHIMLVYSGMTTYEFIVAEQKKSREKKLEKMRLQKEKTAASKLASSGVSMQSQSPVGSTVSKRLSPVGIKVPHKTLSASPTGEQDGKLQDSDADEEDEEEQGPVAADTNDKLGNEHLQAVYDKLKQQEGDGLDLTITDASKNV